MEIGAKARASEAFIASTPLPGPLWVMANPRKPLHYTCAVFRRGNFQSGRTKWQV